MTNPEERIYIIVPETVQTMPNIPGFVPDPLHAVSINMEPGRLMAQCCHVGRGLQDGLQEMYDEKYRDITTIVLSVRNSKELNKITEELRKWAAGIAGIDSLVVEFFDENPPFYQTTETVHTATIVGPVDNSEVLDHIIGHLELYK